MLGSEYGDDTQKVDRVANVGSDVSQILLLRGTDSIVCEKHEEVVARQAPERVMQIDPRRHAVLGSQVGARRS